MPEDGKALLGFQYQLTLCFDGEACRHSFTLRCVPRDSLRQRVLSEQVVILPDVPVTRGRDCYGNVVYEGTVHGRHSSFSVSVQGTAEVPAGEPEDPVPEEEADGDDAMVFRQHTRRTVPGPAIESFLASAPDCACDDLSRAVGLMHRLHSVFRYEKGVTDTDTTAEEAMSIGAGVCQDYAQIMLSLLRSRGIPCRYVVGFTVGEGESHAWVEVLHDGLWYGLDPTGDCAVGPRHVKVSHGRDYGDCRINRGVFFGARAQSQLVRAAVSPPISE